MSNLGPIRSFDIDEFIVSFATRLQRRRILCESTYNCLSSSAGITATNHNLFELSGSGRIGHVRFHSTTSYRRLYCLVGYNALAGCKTYLPGYPRVITMC